MSALFLAVLLAVAAGEPEGGGPVEPPPHAVPAGRFEWIALPTVDYDADEKFGIGVSGQLYWIGDSQPYNQALTVKAYLTSGGVQRYRVHYDAPRFLDVPVRLWLTGEYKVDLFAPYYGLGNASSSRPEDYPALSGSRIFQWTLHSPYARAGAALPLGRAAYAFAYLSYRWITVSPYQDSLLAAQRPIGFEGGGELEGTIGAYFDRRDHEIHPSRGYYLEASVRGVGPASTGDFAGFNVRTMYFLSPLSWLTLATRLEADWLSARAPFFELSGFGGVHAFDGIGGGYTARGLPKDRYIGRLKAIGTLEARTRLLDVTILERTVSFGPAAFVDAGRVWQLDGSDAPGLGVHATVGGGLRLWRGSHVARLDFGISSEGTTGLYAILGHFF
jgi:outer membrane protein assembly factor BamA